MANEFYGEDWNMALAYFKRIDDLLTVCDFAQMKGKGFEWYKALFCLYKEIRAKMNDKQKAEADELIKRITIIKNDAMRKEKGSIPTESLVEFELFLRDVLEKKNMLTPKSSDPATAFRDG